MPINHRNTEQRDIILKNVKSRKDHPSADDVFISVKKDNPTISRGTVYRNLDLLSKQGKILHIHLSDTADRYDSTVEPHYHFVCIKCKKVYDIECHCTDKLKFNYDNSDDFKILRYELTFKGICKECLKKDENT